MQQGAMAAIAILSYFVTPVVIREKNRFTFAPIIEVAVLFAGIFITMIPALQILNANGHKLGIDQPWEYFWAAGTLSSFLDNAPTYLTFAATACGLEDIKLEGNYLYRFLELGKEANMLLAAISCGAVFMGANTYIGNGPNFMVKAIAEENGVKMPSFFGYMVYSGCILIPIFIVVTFAYFR
jgi:Na+/H+ antiporter NhaD/arsenite permease-like protein